MEPWAKLLCRLDIHRIETSLATQSAASERPPFQAKDGKYEEYSSSLLQWLVSWVRSDHVPADAIGPPSTKAA